MATPANAIPKIEAWILAQLAGDSALAAIVSTRIWKDIAPIDTTYPYVIFAMRPGSYYLQGVGECRLLTRAEYLIKIVTEGDASDAEIAALDRFDEVIGAQSASLLNGFLFSGRGRAPISYTEPRPGTPHFYNHAGSVFQIDSYPAP